MKKLLTLFAAFGTVLISCSISFGQAPIATSGSGPAVTTPSVSITASTSPEELARIALAAQGGDKFRQLQNMILRGSVDLFAPNSTQSIPGGFVIVTAGDKIRMEIDARPAISFKQIYDGQQSYSSIPGVELPPASKFGLSVLGRFDSPGFKVTTVPDKKKQRGFRITDPDGNATEFYVDATTGRVMSFYIGYAGYTFATENKKFKEYDGVLIPISFTQRLEMPQGAFFADYKVKDVRLNQQLGEDVFTIPN